MRGNFEIKDEIYLSQPLHGYSPNLLFEGRQDYNGSELLIGYLWSCLHAASSGRESVNIPSNLLQQADGKEE